MDRNLSQRLLEGYFRNIFFDLWCRDNSFLYRNMPRAMAALYYNFAEESQYISQF